MAELYRMGDPQPSYVDRKWGSEVEFKRALASSSTLYIGNLSFFTTEEQIYELFSKCGEIKRIIMGLDRVTKTPLGLGNQKVEHTVAISECQGACEAEEDAGDAVKYINGTKLDDRVIRVDWDAGFKESRQFGRGISGGQVRDEYRTDYDPGRGGYGRQVQQELSDREIAMLRYEPITEIPRGSLHDSHSNLSTPGGSKRDRENDDAEQPTQKRWKNNHNNSRDYDEEDEEFEGRNPRFRKEKESGDNDDDE